MDLQKITATTFRSLIFAILAAVMSLPILLSVPGISDYIKNALSMIGIGN
mgnify:FL=1